MIRITIQRKLLFAIFAIAATMAVLLLLFMRWSLDQGFSRYAAAVELSRLDWIVSNAEAAYRRNGNWNFLRSNRGEWQRLQRRSDRDSEPPAAPDAPPPWRDRDSDAPPEWRYGPPKEGPPKDGLRGYGPPRGGPPNDALVKDVPPRDDAPFARSNNASTSSGYAVSDAIPGPKRGARSDARNIAPDDGLGIGPRLALLDANGNFVAGSAEAMPPAGERSLRVDGKLVGALVLGAATATAGTLDDAFLASQTRNLAAGGLAALAFSLLVAWLLSRHLLAPIRELAAGARAISRGKLDARIAVTRSDELGALASDFNTMAGQLARTEEIRRAWVADTSHELRTPLAVLRAEIEALQDGVRNADSGTLQNLHKQVQHLAKLVDDLRLTLDERPGAKLQLERTDVLALLRDTIDSFRARYSAAGLRIDTTAISASAPDIHADADRLRQVFANLLENTLRYTHSGGRLHVSAETVNGLLRIAFDDSAPAPPAEVLPRLFERFFRAEPSRSRAHGGSGLGLAICKTIVEAHGGTIDCSLSKIGGLRMLIELPVGKAA
jgi:two-component system sensor histidine kinase BaeS